MRRRRLLLGARAVVLLGVAGFVVFFLLQPLQPGVTWGNYRQIHIGMTLKETEDSFGKPPDSITFYDAVEKSQVHGLVIDLSSGQSRWHVPTLPPKSPITHWWIGKGVTIFVKFVDGRVSEWHIETDETFLDRIRRWLNW